MAEANTEERRAALLDHRLVVTRLPSMDANDERDGDLDDLYADPFSKIGFYFVVAAGLGIREDSSK